MSLASAFLVFLLLRRGMDEFRALSWADLKPFAFLGFSGLFVSTGGTYLGIAFTAATSATILQAATPVMVAIGSLLYLKERLRPEQWAGVLCGMLGVLVVVTDGSLRAVLRAELRPGDFILERRDRWPRRARRRRAGDAAGTGRGGARRRSVRWEPISRAS
jgi:drug/metabolite transporter (DMT)-like permease